MKPISLTTSNDPCRDLFNPAARQRSQAPLTDYSYYSIAIEGPSGSYARKPARSFWNIAGDYLNGEARHDFWSEATLFALITLTAALPLMNNLHALIEFARATISH
jgi:hypothetical protein